MKRSDALLWARTTRHGSRIDSARSWIDQAFGRTDSWCIAFSGGKDSTCVLDLVRSMAPSIPAQFSAREWDMPETMALIDATPNLRKTAHLDYDGTDWLPSWSSEQAAIAAGAQWLDPTTYASARGIVEQGVFLGLRSDENAYRKKHIQSFGLLFRTNGGIWHSNPIAYWSVLDIWAYLLSRKIPYNPAYDVMERLGVPLEMQRIGPFGRALHAGSLAILKRGWPEQFNRLAARHPEARQYA